MAFELEALVGHMYVAGGRTIKTTPPGALCEVAPKRAARGREIDTLFVLVVPSGTLAPNTFYEQMALMAAERYFSNTGSVTSALRDVYNTLNNNLFEHNTSGHKHYEANMLMAVMRGTDLYVARAGAATLVLRHSGENQTVPTPLTDDDKLFKPPLGVQPIPEVEMSRFTLDSGTRLVIADASIAEITEEKLTQALVASNIEEVLDDFKTLVTLQIQMMVVEFVPPEQAVMVPAATGQSSAVIAAEIAAARAKTGTITPDDEQTEDTPAARPPRQTPQDRLKERAKGATVSVSRGLGHSFTRIGNLSRKLFGGEVSPQRRRRNITIMAIAVFAIPTILVLTVMVTWATNIGETVYEDCVGRATDAANTARALPPESRTSLITAWNATLLIINECQEYRPEFVDYSLDTIQSEAQLAVDSLGGITRREAQVVWASRDSDANIREIVLQGVDTLYAFDNTNSIVYRMQLDESGTALISDAQPVTFMSIGARVDGNTVARLIGIAVDEQRNRIVALDERGLLISCRALSSDQCSSQQLQGFERIGTPIRFEFWRDKFYVLDIGGQQIWRFAPINNTDNYSNVPTEYYASGQRPSNLDQAVDLAIGSTTSAIDGHVYTLFDDGTMAHYYSGNNEGFFFQVRHQN